MVDVMNKWWIISLAGGLLLLVVVVAANRGGPDEPRASDLETATSESRSESDSHDHEAGESHDGHVHGPVSDPADPDGEIGDNDDGDHDVTVDEKTTRKYEKEATKTVTAFSKEVNKGAPGWHKRIEPYTIGRLHDGLKMTDPERLVDRGAISDTEVLDSDVGWIAMTVTYEDGSTLLFGVTHDQPHWRVETYQPYRPEDGS